MMTNSYLMVAGDKQKHLDKLDSLKCDIAIVNLEDGVFDKETARKLVFDNLKHKDNKHIVVRVNDLNTCGKEDIELINQIKPKAIRVAKIKTIKDVQVALNLIDDEIEVHLSIETKEALHNLETLKVNLRVTTVYLGILDMLESLCLPQSLVQLNNPTIDYILSRFLISSKIAGFEPVSFVYQDYKNLEEFTLWCEKEKKLGFVSKVCISPSQVDIVNNLHITDEIELQKSKYIIKTFEKNKANKNTAIADNLYGFVDEPIYKDALLFLKNNQ